MFSMIYRIWFMKFRHTLFIKNAEPTDFAITMERIAGVIFLVISIIVNLTLL